MNKALAGCKATKDTENDMITFEKNISNSKRKLKKSEHEVASKGLYMWMSGGI